MSYESASGMGTNGATISAIPETVPTPEPQRSVVATPPEQPEEVDLAARQMLQLASYFRPEGIASAWIFMIPLMAVPAVSGAVGAGSANRLGGAAYGVVAGTVAGLLAWPALRLALPQLSGRSGLGIGLAGLAAALTVPAYFAGKRAQEEA
jgi:hypothetical protein